jgi:hypothetical protein
MRHVLGGIVLGALALGIGCAHESSKPAPEAKYPPPPATSKLSKVQLGMTEPQVAAILGEPNDCRAYVTGKAFIPFYYGPDQSRFACYYRGVGRVVFEGGNQWGAGRGKVQRVEYDPNEDGNAATK